MTRRFIASGIEISPIKLPLGVGVFTPSEMVFDGLYGVFNDSLPDGWGRLLLDRTVEKHGLRRGQLNALDRLAYVGQNGIGALSYEPDRSGLSGLIHADRRQPTLDYDMILRVVMALTKNVLEAEVYAVACFNVLAHNRDDHPKNFSFLLNEENAWVLAPAYDLTFSHGPVGEQSTMVMGEGKNPGLEHLQTLGKKHGLKRARQILAGRCRRPRHAGSGMPMRPA
jgi:hypothetical protein